MNEEKNRSRFRKGCFYAVLLILLAVATIGLIEATAEFLLNNSRFLGGNLLKAFRTYYMEKDRKIIQILPECAQYDDELIYTLKPGTCRIRAREYTVDYDINSVGIRDDEKSLQKPEIVVIGDSFAMGWGVEQQYSFPAVLEKKVGLRSLNAAVSSYGTIRELKLLRRIDLTGLRVLVIQYCSNDYAENNEYFKQAGKLPVMPEDEYNAIVDFHRDNTRYYPGKHAVGLATGLVESLCEKPKPAVKAAKISEAVDLFLHALEKSPVSFDDVMILVLVLDSIESLDNRFQIALQKRLHSAKKEHPLYRNIEIVDLSRRMGKEYYYPLDGHITVKGHEIVAEALAQKIREISK